MRRYCASKPDCFCASRMIVSDLSAAASCCARHCAGVMSDVDGVVLIRSIATAAAQQATVAAAPSSTLQRLRYALRCCIIRPHGYQVAVASSQRSPSLSQWLQSWHRAAELRKCVCVTLVERGIGLHLQSQVANAAVM